MLRIFELSSGLITLYLAESEGNNKGLFTRHFVYFFSFCLHFVRRIGSINNEFCDEMNANFFVIFPTTNWGNTITTELDFNKTKSSREKQFKNGNSI